jgi:peptidoglycan/xylan/chitin deacetylase (PgdA/CDA1 family)
MIKRLIFLFIFIIFITVSGVPVYAGAGQKLPVLLYHHILPRDDFKSGNAFVIAAEDFEAHMRYLHENGYTSVTLDGLRAFLYDKEPLPEKSVMITFDDGYYSNIQYAYPILKEYGFTAVIFLITEKAGDKPFPAAKLSPGCLITKEYMDGTEDVFEYATHTHNMHNKSNGKSKLADSSHDEIVKDIQESLTWVGNQYALAYPHGQHNKTVIDAVKEAGIEIAFAITRGYVLQNSNPFTLHRFVVYQETSLSQIKAYMEGAAR